MVDKMDEVIEMIRKAFAPYMTKGGDGSDGEIEFDGRLIAGTRMESGAYVLERDLHSTRVIFRAAKIYCAGHMIHYNTQFVFAHGMGPDKGVSMFEGTPSNPSGEPDEDDTNFGGTVI